MNREQIIKDIFTLKNTAIEKGYDWPTNDNPNTATDIQLHYFLQTVNDFLESEK
jgi:hypothetical protein